MLFRSVSQSRYKAAIGNAVPSGAELKYFDVREVAGFAAASGGIPVAHAIQTFCNIKKKGIASNRIV